MKSNIKFLGFAVLFLCSTAVRAQNDAANQTMQTINEALSQNDCDRAQRAYNAWKVLTEKTNSDIEVKLKQCKQGAHTSKTYRFNLLNDQNLHYCNGVYYQGLDKTPDARFFQYPLITFNKGGQIFEFNKRDFRISFDFLVGEYPKDIKRDGWIGTHSMQWAIMLSTGGRLLGFCLYENGGIKITTNNQDNIYPLKGIYKLNTWHNVTLECQDGLLSVYFDNNPVETVVVDIKTSDYTLTSINYSNGIAFKGYLRNIKVSCN